MSSKLVDKSLEECKSQNDDDYVDRLNYVYSAIMFGTFGAVIGAKQFFGSTIECFNPPEFHDTWNTYALDYCFVQDTYFLPMNESFPAPEVREESKIHYYQWMSFILFGHFLSFVLPKLFLGTFNYKTGLSFQTIATSGDLDEEDIQKKSKYLLRSLRAQKEALNKHKYTIWGQINYFIQQSSVTLSYLFFKLWNTANTIVQLILVNKFVAPKTQNGIWGLDVVYALVDTHAWKTTNHFPRITFCDFSVREIAPEPVTYTVQCVLMMNLLYEKVYLIIWFWLLILSILNTINLIQWTIRALYKSSSEEFVVSQLNFKDVKYERKDVPQFISKFLGLDAITALRLAELNAGSIVSSNVIKDAWSYFIEERKELMANNLNDTKKSISDYKFY